MVDNRRESLGTSFLNITSFVEALPSYGDYLSKLENHAQPADFAEEYLTTANIHFESVRDVSTEFREPNGDSEHIRAIEIILSHANVDQKIKISSDVDDTTIHYSPDKASMHAEWVNILGLTKYMTEASTDLLLAKINKQSRILPSSGTHPEQYSPILELAATTYLKFALEQPEFRKSLQSEIHGHNFDEWIRSTIIAPTISGKNAYLPAGAIEIKSKAKNGQNKSYFQIEPGFENLLVTPTVGHTEKLPCFFKSQEQRNIFSRLTNSFTQHMYDNQIIQGMVLDRDYEAEYIFSSFGETRYQLIKIINLIKAMQRSHLRLPDKIVLFSEGRKARMLQKLYGQDGNRVFHIDNSQSQIEEIRQLNDINIVPIYRPYPESKQGIVELLPAITN